MTVTILPRDADDRPIPALRLRPGAAQSVAVTAASARNATAFNAETRVVSFYATVPMFVRLGDATVTATATDHYLPAETYLDVAVGGGRVPQTGYAAFVRASSDGTVYISEKF